MFIIVVLDVCSDINHSLSETEVGIIWHPFRFITPEKELHWSIVPTIATPTHALCDLVMPQLLAEYPTCVMTALVRMKE